MSMYDMKTILDIEGPVKSYCSKKIKENISYKIIDDVRSRISNHIWIDIWHNCGFFIDNDLVLSYKEKKNV